jgi:hypothetical protein
VAWYVEGVVAQDEAVDLGSLGVVEPVGGGAGQVQQVADRGSDLDGGALDDAEPGPVVGEQHRPLDLDALAAAVQEALELGGGFVELAAR